MQAERHVTACEPPSKPHASICEHSSETRATYCSLLRAGACTQSGASNPSTGSAKTRTSHTSTPHLTGKHTAIAGACTAVSCRRSRGENQSRRVPPAAACMVHSKKLPGSWAAPSRPQARQHARCRDVDTAVWRNRWDLAGGAKGLARNHRCLAEDGGAWVHSRSSGARAPSPGIV